MAHLVLHLLERDLDHATRLPLARAAQGGGCGSLMAVDFADPAIPADAAHTLTALLNADSADALEAANPERLNALLDTAQDRLGLAEGRISFKYGWANHQTRAAIGLELSRRRYNKLFRLAACLEQEALNLRRQSRLSQLDRGLYVSRTARARASIA